jgi:hypothetical protein
MSYKPSAFDKGLYGCGMFAAGLQLLGVLGCGGILLLFIIGPIACPRDKSGDVAEKQRETAYAYAEVAIQNQLKSPASAQFPLPSDPTVSMRQAGPDGEIILIESYVDAQNSFGALLRQRWTARVECRPGSDRATVISAELKE